MVQIYGPVLKVFKRSGNRYTINDNNKNDIVLEIGDKVNRHIVDNDYVLFNDNLHFIRFEYDGT